MSYFIMASRGGGSSGQVAEEPRLQGGTWMKGRPLQIEVPEPLEYVVDEDYPGKPPPLCDELAIPIARIDLLEALRGAGVDNLETFDAIVRDQGNTYSDFRAFNIVGLVAAADAEKSKRFGGGTSEIVDVDFERLVIDEEAAGGLLLFRLAEAVSAIVVHESVRAAVESAQIEGVAFYGPGEWMG